MSRRGDLVVKKINLKKSDIMERIHEEMYLVNAYCMNCARKIKLWVDLGEVVKGHECPICLVNALETAHDQKWPQVDHATRQEEEYKSDIELRMKENMKRIIADRLKVPEGEEVASDSTVRSIIKSRDMDKERHPRRQRAPRQEAIEFVDETKALEILGDRAALPERRAETRAESRGEKPAKRRRATGASLQKAIMGGGGGEDEPTDSEVEALLNEAKRIEDEQA